MEHQSQRGGGGALASLQQPSPEGRPRLEFERDVQRAAVLSLDQIRAIRSCNNYTEGPTAPRRAAPPRAAPRPDKQERTHEVININNNNYEHRAPGPQYGPRAPVLSRSTSTGSAASSGSNSSVSSEHGLLGRPQPACVSSPHRPERAVRTQPKARALPPPEEVLKPPAAWEEEDGASGHRFVCEQCGRCKCAECTAPRTLPSCLACGGQCLCSAESLLEHGTCMCLVKGLFYHCSNDDEGDSCADSPCSLSRSHCCSRFLCMGLMSTLFPCLLCYPARQGLCEGLPALLRPGHSARLPLQELQHCLLQAGELVTPKGAGEAILILPICKLENWSPTKAQGSLSDSLCRRRKGED
ncbi:hypothetical protein SKAU_G00031370 [Synaphobranchus kaupii]|uniref:Protein sprouty homolog 1 n=1 Tax=Synaphobranchus kaupii TaxID=118154 RepID=A0A9Q1GF48_SYNKA|nr:hypothetical protein SKAU_G00031370 [Synaphobranchus kaupii]